MKLLWTEAAWKEYCNWQNQDKKILKKLNEIIKDMQRNPQTGIGKPEQLKGDLSGLWSRRIDGANRIVYRIKDDAIEILACKNHY